VYRLSEILSEQRAATKENVERKQARTEMEREESDEEASDDDGNQVTIVYLPKLFLLLVLILLVIENETFCVNPVELVCSVYFLF
jgi:hypothetical protein